MANTARPLMTALAFTVSLCPPGQALPVDDGRPTMVVHIDNDAKIPPVDQSRAQDRATGNHVAADVRPVWGIRDQHLDAPELHVCVSLLCRGVAELKMRADRVPNDVLGQAAREARRTHIFTDRVAHVTLRPGQDSSRALGHTLAHETPGDQCNRRFSTAQQSELIRSHVATSQTPALGGFADSRVRVVVQRAVQGAATRLKRQRCQYVLADFVDKFDRSLLTTLDLTGRSPTEAFGSLRFVDASAAPQCRNKRTLAFTEIGSPIIHVCGRQFADAFRRDPMMTEIIVLHEFLHALGLGENPPISTAITKRVAARCGD